MTLAMAQREDVRAASEWSARNARAAATPVRVAASSVAGSSVSV